MKKTINKGSVSSKTEQASSVLKQPKDILPIPTHECTKALLRYAKRKLGRHHWCAANEGRMALELVLKYGNINLTNEQSHLLMPFISNMLSETSNEAHRRGVSDGWDAAKKHYSAE